MAFLDKNGKIQGNYDEHTGVPFLLTPTNTFIDGTPMTDAKVDNAIYYKVNHSKIPNVTEDYARRNFDTVLSTRILGTNPSETTFRKFIAAIGSDKVVLNIDQPIGINTNLIIPKNITVQYIDGGFFRTPVDVYVDVKSNEGTVTFEQFGAIDDGVEYDGIASMEFNSNVLTTSTPIFSPSDVNKSISVRGAGTLSGSSYRVLSTVISAYDSPTQVRLQNLSTYAVTNERVVFGTDNTQALYRFNSWAKNMKGRVTLLLKQGKTYIHKSARWSYNILNFVLEGNNSHLLNIATNVWDRCPLFTCSNLKLDQRDGVVPGSAEGYLLNLATKDSKTVTLKTISEASNFTVGEWVLIASSVTSLRGFPPDYRYFDYVYITAINLTTGTLTIDSALKFTHKEDALWSSAAEVSQRVSGRASIIKLERGSKFGITHVYNNLKLTCDTDAEGGAIRLSGKDVTMNNCTGWIFVPTAFQKVRMNNCLQLNETSNEFDKLGVDYEDNGSNWQLVTNGGGILSTRFNNSTFTKIESLSARNIELNNFTKVGSTATTSFVIGDRPGGTNRFVINGGNSNQQVTYPLQFSQVKKVQLGVGGVTYANGRLSIPISEDTISVLNYIEEGKRMDVLASGLGKATGLNNHGYIKSFGSTDGLNAYVDITFKTPLTQPDPSADPPVAGSIVGIFTEPEQVEIKGLYVNGLKEADRNYLQMTYNPKYEDQRFIAGYNRTVNVYGGALIKMVIHVKKPYTGSSAVAQGRVDGTYPTNTPIVTFDLKVAGTREITFSTRTTPLGTDVLPTNFSLTSAEFKSEYRLRTIGTILGTENEASIVSVYFYNVDV